MATEYTLNGYELVKLAPKLFHETHTAVRLTSLIKETNDPDVEEALSDAFLAQIDVMVPLMARMMKLRENMKVLELKEELDN